MTFVANIVDHYQRYRSLRTDHITSLPIVILMPHSACNCRCMMCDIWKDNKNLKQLTEADIETLLVSLKQLGTRRVVMSGGEALLNPNFFLLCRILRDNDIQVSLLSTGITLKKHSKDIVDWVSEVIVSLDGPQPVHDEIRNIPNAFQKLQEGVQSLKLIDPGFKVNSRTVIHRINFRHWHAIIETAKRTGIDQASFLPADVSSHAFNREVLWTGQRQHDLLLDKTELFELEEITHRLIEDHKDDFDSGFIAENPDEIKKIYGYYAAFHGMNSFPCKRCNAPWVSTVVEADGTVRPCFFHPPMGNIHDQSLSSIINSKESTQFRKELDIDTNPVCVKCVCYLNLSPGTRF